jgi:hypothetical protein
MLLGSPQDVVSPPKKIALMFIWIFFFTGGVEMAHGELGRICLLPELLHVA